MLRPFANITIGDLFFDFLNSVEVSSSWDSLTDTGTIVLPGKLKKGGQTLIAGQNNLFKRGDSVEISLGYYPRLARIFTGYISGVVPDSPLVVKVEDSAYLFKQKSITVSFETTNLKNLLAKLCPIPFETVDAELGSLRLTRVNFAQVLEELRNTYGIVSFVRDGTLYCGLAYWPDQRVDHSLSFQKNIISSSLEYQRADDIQIKVKAISILPNNKKIEIEVGDPDGAQKTLNFYNLSEKELKEAAEREFPRLKYEGYRGSLTTFGEPAVKHGDGITLTDAKFPERAGTYLVDEVVTSLSMNGFRQTIKLGPKI